MKADIFIPTSNRIDSLTQCLDSLAKQSDKNFRVILVGMKKSPEVSALIKKYKRLPIVYMIQSGRGLVAAANDALGIAAADIFIRIDDDVILDKNWLKYLLETYRSDRRIGGVTGPTVMTEKGLRSRDLTAFLETFKRSNNPVLRFIFYVYHDILYEKRMNDVSRFLESGVFTIGSNYKSALNVSGLVEVNNLEACNWSARTRILKNIGGFDERYTKGLGDYHEADAAMRIKESGYNLIFNPKAHLTHNVEVGTIEKARPAAFYRIQNFIYFYFRFFKVKSAKQLFKFLINLGLQNAYFVYRFVTTGNIGQLGALFGTMIGLLKVPLIKRT